MNRHRFRAAAAAGFALCLAGTVFAGVASAQEIRPDPGYSAAARQDRVEELERLLAEANDRADRAEYRQRLAEEEIRRLQRMVSELTTVRDAVDEIERERDARDQEGALQAPGEGDLADQELDGAETPESVYANAQALMRAGRLGEAESEYDRFLARYANDPNAPSAKYWRAFTQLARGEPRDAALGFNDYLQDYPSGRYAPDALVRLGVALRGVGLNEDACRAFADFSRRYPRAERSLRDIALRETTALNCA